MKGGRIETRKGYRYFLKNAVVKGCLFENFLFFENIDVPFMTKGQKIPTAGSRVSLDFIVNGKQAIITSLRTLAAA